MAQITSKSGKGSPSVDLTPMVDLGFLLITFFMFTTTMSKPMAMELQMPFVENSPPQNPSLVKESTAMTILLGANHQLHYYFGLDLEKQQNPIVNTTRFSDKEGIRDAIISKKIKVQQGVANGDLKKNDQISILIKPSPNSTADDLIEILDEMRINNVKVYTVVDIGKKEMEMIGQ